MLTVCCHYETSDGLRKAIDQLIYDAWAAEAHRKNNVQLLVNKGASVIDPLDRLAAHVLAYDTSGVLVGYGRLSFLNGQELPAELSLDAELKDSSILAYMSRLVVHPDYQGQGISKVIHRTRVKLAVAVGAENIFGWAVGDLPTRNLLSLGFQPVKVKQGFQCGWYSTSRRTTLMKLDLTHTDSNLIQSVAN